MELKEKYTFVSEKHEDGTSTFTWDENERYIDILNLNKYTKKQLINIYGGEIKRATKAEYIIFIERKYGNAIRQENRNIALKTLLKQ